ncbi:MAG: DUF2505 domain-containing protein, partial [Angustibacter sp.]
MNLTASITYAAPPSAVLAMLLTEEFQARVCERTGATSHEVSVIGTAEAGSVITATRVIPATDLPDFVRSFAGPQLTVRRVDTWGPLTGTDVEGDTVVEILGTPVRFTGRLSLRATSEGAREELSGEL